MRYRDSTRYHVCIANRLHLFGILKLFRDGRETDVFGFSNDTLSASKTEISIGESMENDPLFRVLNDCGCCIHLRFGGRKPAAASRRRGCTVASAAIQFAGPYN